MIEVAVLGTTGAYDYGTCPSAMTLRDQADMVAQLARLKFGDRVTVIYRNLEDGRDDAVAEQVRARRLELPVVLIDDEVSFDGGVPWQDISRALSARCAD